MNSIPQDDWFWDLPYGRSPFSIALSEAMKKRPHTHGIKEIHADYTRKSLNLESKNGQLLATNKLIIALAEVVREVQLDTPDLFNYHLTDSLTTTQQQQLDFLEECYVAIESACNEGK